MVVGINSEQIRERHIESDSTPASAPASTAKSCISHINEKTTKYFAGILGPAPLMPTKLEQEVRGKPWQLLPLVGNEEKGILPTPSKSTTHAVFLPSKIVTSRVGRLPIPGKTPKARTPSSSSFGSYVDGSGAGSESDRSEDFIPPKSSKTGFLKKSSSEVNFVGVGEVEDPSIFKQRLVDVAVQTEPSAQSPEQLLLPIQSSPSSPEYPRQAEHDNKNSEIPRVDLRELLRQRKLPVSCIPYLSRPEDDQGFPGAWEYFAALVSRSWGLSIKAFPHECLLANAEHEGLYALLDYLDRVDAAVYPRHTRASNYPEPAPNQEPYQMFMQRFASCDLTPAMRHHDEARMAIERVLKINPYKLKTTPTPKSMSAALDQLQAWTQGKLHLPYRQYDGTQAFLSANCPRS